VEEILKTNTKFKRRVFYLNKGTKKVLAVLLAMIFVLTLVPAEALAVDIGPPDSLTDGGGNLAGTEAYFGSIGGNPIKWYADRSGSDAVKFTVEDVSQDVEVIATAAQSTQSVPTTGSLSFSYANATTGTNQYVSCVLVDGSNEVAYYGKLADSSAEAGGGLSIPLAGVADGTYTLKIFSEVDNGSNNTDYCSAPVTMMLTVLDGTGTVSNFGGTIDDPVEEKAFKVLFIGNSHTVDAANYFYNIAASAGYTDVKAGAATISGETIAGHYANARGNAAKYVYKKTTGGVTTRTTGHCLGDLLKDEAWDFVILQEATPRSGFGEYYNQDLDGLTAYVKANAENPDVRLGWYMVWAYSTDNTFKNFAADFDRDQMGMYNAITSTVQQKVESHPDISFVVPVGTVVQNLRTSYMADVLGTDGSHLYDPEGDYLAGLCFFRFLSGESLYDLENMPGTIVSLPPDHWPMFRDCVEAAVLKPYAVTSSAHKTAPKKTVEYALDNEKITVSLPADSYVYNGKARKPSPVIIHGPRKLRAGIEYSALYENNINAGTATVTITGIGYYSGTVTRTFKITRAAISKTELTYSLTAKTYNGKPQGVTVKAPDGAGKVTVSYTGKGVTEYETSTKKPTDAGSYTVTVNIAAGMNYDAADFTLGTFKIKRANISRVKIPNQEWTGKKIKPTSFTYNGKSFSVKANTTAQRSYGKNKSIGEGTVKLMGKGNFKGKKTLSFKIVPKKNSVSKITTGTKQMTVRWKRVSAVQNITKYQVRYRVKGKTKWTTRTYDASDSSAKIKKLKKGRQYEVKVRSYKTVSKVKYYSAWSAVKNTGKIK